MSPLFLVLIAFFPFSKSASITRYGTSSPYFDSVASLTDDTAYLMTTLTGYSIYGQDLGNAYAGDNGVVSFNTQQTGTTGSFPLSTPAVALFWTDHNPTIDCGSNCNEVLFRTSTNPTDLTVFGDRVRGYVSGASSFTPTEAFVVTYHDVLEYGESAPFAYNTYQMVLLTDGSETYLTMSYDNMGWSDSKTVGFTGNSGSLPLPSDVALSATCGSPAGRYVFRVDSGMPQYDDICSCSSSMDSSCTQVQPSADCSDENWCSGNGECIDSIEDYCSCNTGYYGSDCSSGSGFPDVGSIGTYVGAIFGGIVGFIVFLIIAAAVISLCSIYVCKCCGKIKKKHKHKHKFKYNKPKYKHNVVVGASVPPPVSVVTMPPPMGGMGGGMGMAMPPPVAVAGYAPPPVAVAPAPVVSPPVGAPAAAGAAPQMYPIGGYAPAPSYDSGIQPSYDSGVQPQYGQPEVVSTMPGENVPTAPSLRGGWGDEAY